MARKKKLKKISNWTKIADQINNLDNSISWINSFIARAEFKIIIIKPING